MQTFLLPHISLVFEHSKEMYYPIKKFYSVWNNSMIWLDTWTQMTVVIKFTAKEISKGFMVNQDLAPKGITLG